jgi:hypothetical protein
MLDRYSLEKLIDAQRVEALNRAAQHRLAAAVRPDRPAAVPRPFAAKIRALASFGLRTLEIAAQHRHG